MNTETGSSIQKQTPPFTAQGEQENKFFYEVSRRPNDKRRKVIAGDRSKLITPSGVKVPPGWINVWITTDLNSQIQATGLDSKGRKVYLYSTEHMGRAAAAKFSRLKAFAEVYPSLVRKLGFDKKTSEEALVLYLISKTGFRIGSDAETRAQVKAFGASTLRCSHVALDGKKVLFNFTGKKGQPVKKILKDKFLADNIAQRCDRNADRKIFATTDDNIRKYLNSIPEGAKFTVKDFRTYLGTTVALREINDMLTPKNEREFKRMRKKVGEVVARELGNTVTIALKSYISPEVFASWQTNLVAETNIIKNRKDALLYEFTQCVHYDQDVPMEECRDNDPLEKQV